MKKIKDIKDKINGLITDANDKALIEKLSEISVLIDDTDKEYETLEKDNIELLKNYKRAVLGLGNNKVDDDDPSEPKVTTLSDVINDVLNKK